MQQFTLTTSWQEVHDGSTDNWVFQVDTGAILFIDSPAQPAANYGLRVSGSQDGRVFGGSGFSGKFVWAKLAPGFGEGRAVVAKW